MRVVENVERKTHSSRLPHRARAVRSTRRARQAHRPASAASTVEPPRTSETPRVSVNSVISRWARLVVRVVDTKADPATISDWARIAHLGESTLREVCRAAGLRGKRSLDLARVLRAVAQLEGRPWRPEAVLSCRDPRTLRALLARTGCVGGDPGWTVGEFLAQQTMLPSDGCLLLALRQALERKFQRKLRRSLP